MSLKVTGKLPNGKSGEKVRQSPNYKQGAFQNLSPTSLKPEGVSYWQMIGKFFKKHPGTTPTVTLPFVKTDLSQLNSEQPTIVWFGHSSYLIRIEHKTFLIDPVFSGNAAPVPGMVKAFPGSNEYRAEDMPAIDYLIITHDHYDHLDYDTIKKLKGKIEKVYCSLGVGAHLEHWGIAEEKITEMDWWQTEQLEQGIQLTAAPSRHFSGRTLKRGQSLWSSFVLKTSSHNLYLGGDSGYDDHFKEIGEKYGPFDIAILEAGQYNTLWPLIHMMPEETVQAAVDLKAKSLLPVHWAKFKLGMHPWNEPVQRVLKKAEELNMPVFTPQIGEPVMLFNNSFQNTPWWNF